MSSSSVVWSVVQNMPLYLRFCTCPLAGALNTQGGFREEMRERLQSSQEEVANEARV